MDELFAICFHENPQLWAISFIRTQLSLIVWPYTVMKLNIDNEELFKSHLHAELELVVNSLNARTERLQKEINLNSDHEQISLFADAPTQ
jgi:hypothetical protein